METESKNMEKRHRCCSPWSWAGWISLGIIGFAAFLVLAGFVIMGLWNWIMPSLFNLSLITFWQAIGIAVLARLIFGNSHRGWYRWRRKRWGHSHGDCCGGSCRCSCHTSGDNYCCTEDASTGHSHGHLHDHSYDKCECNSPKWQYYDQYWEEEGEKAFQDYVKRKTEKSDSTA